MSALVANPEDRFSRDEAHFTPFTTTSCRLQHRKIHLSPEDRFSHGGAQMDRLMEKSNGQICV